MQVLNSWSDTRACWFETKRGIPFRRGYELYSTIVLVEFLLFDEKFYRVSLHLIDWELYFRDFWNLRKLWTRNYLRSNAWLFNFFSWQTIGLFSLSICRCFHEYLWISFHCNVASFLKYLLYSEKHIWFLKSGWAKPIILFES